MFRQLRRQDRELDAGEATAILREGSYGVLSVNGDYGYGVPLNYVYLDGNLYFHCAPEGHKLACIRANPRVSFCVVGQATVLAERFSTAYSSVIAFGSAHEVAEAEKQAALLAFIDKYSPDYRDKGRLYVEGSQHKAAVVRLQIEHISGKARKQ
ncbi:MAG: pyridoxamine 5'-phosphate oxidase family protein [Sporomusaceae bacterium]|nr:pyridoxamine 5'-phosphate oxidase family protein [Sporomusaceae bacterium]